MATKINNCKKGTDCFMKLKLKYHPDNILLPVLLVKMNVDVMTAGISHSMRDKGGTLKCLYVNETYSSLGPLHQIVRLWYLEKKLVSWLVVRETSCFFQAREGTTPVCIVFKWVFKAQSILGSFLDFFDRYLGKLYGSEWRATKKNLENRVTECRDT